uniref:RNA-directed DNA polymerase n=1 Tax=Ceratitis capitata TaxID=7213 RepID=W8AS19_CERCA
MISKNTPNSKTRNLTKIKRMREKAKTLRRIRNKIVSTIVTIKGDNRFFAQTKVGGIEVIALLDSGAEACCLGKNAEKFLQNKGSKIVPVKNQSIRTANGGETPVTGVISLPVLWDGLTRELEFLIVPGLQQEVYLGIDFWKEFNMAVVSRGAGPANTVVSELAPAEGDLAFDSKQHTLTHGENVALEKVKAQFPSFAVLGLGHTDVEEHIIEVEDENIPVKQRHYPISPAIQKLVYQELDRMLDMGVIEESNSSWSSPVSLVIKGTKNRLCLDARKVNERTIKDAYPLPHVDGILSRLQNTRYISAIDLKDAFWQIPLEKKSREKTAFTVPGRPLYHFTVMPFGLCNAAQRMCRLMDKVIPASLRENVFVYLDDLLVCSVDFPSHICLLEKVARCLRDAKLTINVEKSKFCYREVRYLGYVVGDGCIRTDENKVIAVRDFPEPKTPKQLRRFLGMSGWYRRFVQDYATIAAPLHDCLTKDKIKRFVMTDLAKKSFEKLKQSLISAPVLTHPDFNRRFYIQCDASTDGVGGVLFQLDDDNNERPIAYISAKLNRAQRNYSITELECYAAVVSVKRFRPYVEGMPFTIITDHASLKWLMNQKDLSGRLARWSLKLQAYNFDIQHRKGAQNIVPDTLSRMHMEELMLDDRRLDVCLESPYFDSDEYNELRKTVTENKDKLPDMCLSDGYIYKRTQFDSGNELQWDQTWKLWVPSEVRQGLVEAAHGSTSAGHGGIHKTLTRLREKYYWPGMVTDVQTALKNCDTCKENKTTNAFKNPLMKSQHITERPFQRLYIDFMGPYPRTSDGNVFVFICLDHFTKFVFLKPMKRATSAEVVKFLEKEIFHIFGVPEYVHSDNGKQFVSEIFANFLEKYGTKHIRTAFYSPQGNAAERVNRSVLQILRSYIKDNQKHWDKYISEAAFALRSAVHSSIGCTPYFATFGIPMIQHGASYEIYRKLGAIVSADYSVNTKPDQQQLLRNKLMKELKLAHEKSMKVYNTRGKDVRFQIGQVVYRRNFRQSSTIDSYNAKLAPKQVKCIILKVIGNSMYELGDLNGKKVGIYHAKDIFVA